MKDTVVVFRGYLPDNSMEMDQIISSFFCSELFESKYMFSDPSFVEKKGDY